MKTLSKSGRGACSTVILFALAAVSPMLARAEAPDRRQKEDVGPPPLTKLPVLKQQVEAIYPPRAIRDRVAATVLLELDISERGIVENILVRASTVADEASRPLAASSTVADYGFTDSATTAAARLLFEPAESGGQPVPVRIQYTFRFDLPPESTAEDAETSRADTNRLRPSGVARFRGVIRESGTRRRVPGVLVTVFRSDVSAKEETPAGFEATTNDRGEFTFFDLVPGQWHVFAEAEGYYPLRTSENVTTEEVVEVTYFVERGSYNPYDVIVEADRVRKEVNRRALSAAEIVKVPGTLGDPINVVENMPGVARTPAGGAIIYHFGGVKSIVPAEVIEEVEFYPGNFSVQYGRATGGMFNARTKRITADEFNGSVDVSLLDAAVYLEVPVLDDLTVGFAGRRSYIDYVLEAAVPEDASVSLVAAPRYYDYQAFVTYRPSSEHELRLFFFGSDDETKLLFDEPADIDAQLRGRSVEASISFNRIIASYDYAPSGVFQNRLRVAAASDVFRTAAFGQFGSDLNYQTIQFRENACFKASDSIAFSAGVEGIVGAVDVDVRAPRPPKEGDPPDNQDFDDIFVVSLRNEPILSFAPFAEIELFLFERLRLVPGIRGDYFEQTESWTMDPRIVARYDLGGDFVVKAGAGLTHQAPTNDETSEAFGNPDLEPERAIQYSAGVEWMLRDHLKLDLTFFYKDLHNVVSRTNRTVEKSGEVIPLVYDNGGSGRVLGAELFIEHEFHENFRGWLSYTLSRAERTDSGESTSRLFDFDQTHILAIVASYLFRENWELGVRWRLVSGNPHTAYTSSVYYSDFDRYTPVPGRLNDERLPFFHQLDVRLEKRWIYDYWTLAAYLNLVNSYNNANVEGLSYNFNFRLSEPISGLPILPILGLKAEF